MHEIVYIDKSVTKAELQMNVSWASVTESIICATQYILPKYFKDTFGYGILGNRICCMCLWSIGLAS